MRPFLLIQALPGDVKTGLGLETRFFSESSLSGAPR